MFNVYCEREIFEDICLFDDYPNWKKIFMNQTQVLLNMSDDELNDELLNPESPIFLFQNANAGAVVPKALDGQFRALKENIPDIINHPRDAFIFDIDPDDADRIAKDFGTAVFSSKNLNDTFFTGGFFKELELNQHIPGGWKSLISIDLPVSNSLIVSDDYFFENEDNGINCGLTNVTRLIDAFLPDNIKVDYHITIIAPKGNKNSRAWWIKKFGTLKAEVTRLRPYTINIEMVFADTTHKRRIISNYINGWTDKGFSIFRGDNPEKVRGVNDIHIYRVFDNINNSGDTHYTSASNGIEQIKHHCTNAVKYIQSQGDSEHAMIFGDCNKDNSIKNRLLN